MSEFPPVTAHEAEAQNDDLVAANIDALKSLFPDAVSEDRFDFEVLRQLLGDAVDDGDEKYGLSWNGKRRARRIALTPSMGTLRPAQDDSEQWDSTRNLVIEGDNLEVLKLLQKSYAGRVKLIYIDPPYNTGGDFIYPDDYVDSVGNYLRRTAQVGDGGVRNTSSPEGGGRYHTDWLNMMYPRLKLARNLLSDDGFIFVSIDYRELANLRLLLDNVFGEQAFVSILSRVKTRTPAGLSGKTKSIIEYIVCYERNNTATRLLGIEKPAQSANTLLNQPNPIGELTFPAGTPTGIADGRIPAGAYGSSNYNVDLLGDVEVRGGTFVTPFTLRARFRWSQEYLDRQIEAGTRIRIATRQLLPSYDKDSYGREAMPNLVDASVGAGTNENASAELTELMGKQVFDYPKPVSLLRYLINSCTTDDLIMDFFAGSGTTGHAVMSQNAADGGKRRYILVQLPEPLDPSNPEQKLAAEFCDSLGRPRNIAELTKERLRRAGARVQAEAPATAPDVGFRVYKLATSNLKAWTPGTDLEVDLLSAADNIVGGRSEEDAAG